MKKVIVTGASGFIGRHAIPLLIERGFEVHAVFHTPQQELQQEAGNLFWHNCNLLNSEEQKQLLAGIKPSHLLHLAWYAVPGKYWTSLENLHWVQASLDLLQTFVLHGGQRVVMAGTCAEYDWKYGYLSEGITPLLPKTLYGNCKHALQTMLTAFAKQTGISAAWGRIFFVYGPHEHQSRLVPSVIRSLLKGNPASCTHGKQVRDFLYVEDVASAFVSLLGNDFQGAVNIGSGQPVSIKDIVTIICNKIGHPDLIHWGAIPTKPDEPYLLMADIQRLKEDINWTARYSLDTGLNKTIQWWKNNI